MPRGRAAARRRARRGCRTARDIGRYGPARRGHRRTAAAPRWWSRRPLVRSRCACRRVRRRPTAPTSAGDRSTASRSPVRLDQMRAVPSMLAVARSSSSGLHATPTMLARWPSSSTSVAPLSTRQTLTTGRSSDALATRAPDRSNTLVASWVPRGIVFRSEPDSASNSLALPSEPSVRMAFPEGANWAEKNGPPAGLMVRSSSSLEADQSRTVLSAPSDTMRLPAGIPRHEQDRPVVSLEGGEAGAAARVPDGDGVVGVAGDALAVAAERRHAAGVPDRDELRTGGRVPHPGDRVQAHRQDVRAVGLEGHREDVSRVVRRPQDRHRLGRRRRP